MTARLLRVSSPIGKELDSLADVVTFGVAPSAMVFALLSTQNYPASLTAVSEYIPYLAFVMAALSALRLAKFNLDERQTTSFIGLPTPANALFWGSLIIGGESFLSSSIYNVAAVIVLVFIMSYLLVAEIPMFALKFKSWGWKGNEVKYIFLITCIPLLALLKLSGFAAIIAWYVVLSAITKKKSS
jgi:CDP-diacylglycerol--serine O-phosphatidyltransferase